MLSCGESINGSMNTNVEDRWQAAEDVDAKLFQLKKRVTSESVELRADRTCL